MLHYIEAILIPYVIMQRHVLGKNMPVLAIMDNFKGQITTAITARLEENLIHICLYHLIPPIGYS